MYLERRACISDSARLAELEGEDTLKTGPQTASGQDGRGDEMGLLLTDGDWSANILRLLWNARDTDSMSVQKSYP